MGKIVILDENTSNKIAAGEVVERPASVVKEMVENSIDAGASAISVEIKNGGISYIKITDNGSGIDEDDTEIAFERHATSKIRNSEDLEEISTMGFRGEALASIASVSNVELVTRVSSKSYGRAVVIQGGALVEANQRGCPVGTTFVVKNLFYNTPARYKFLKKDSTEAGYISDIIERIALANPQISFKLVSNNVTLLHTPGNNDLKSTIYSIYGKENAQQTYEINYEDSGIKITGYAGKPEIARANRNYQSIFLNGRYIKSKLISAAIDEAYKTFLMKSKFPFIVLNIKVNPSLVDVNVHPTKMEVRFSDESAVFRCILHAVSNAIISKSYIKSIAIEEKKVEKKLFSFEGLENIKKDFIQHEIPRSTYIPVLEQSSNKPLPYTEKSVVGTSVVLEKNTEYNTSQENELPQNSNIIEKQKEYENILENPQNNRAIEINELKVVDLDLEEEVLEAAVDIKEKEKNIFENTKFIGQIFSTYILLQKSEEVLMIDQHAAHERIIYERLKSKFSANESLAQMLVSPVAIEFTSKEYEFLLEERSDFEKLGFIYNEFGNNCIILRSIPYTIDGNEIKKIFIEFVDNVFNSNVKQVKNITDETLYSIACKSAVKANKKLDELEVMGLLKDLNQLDIYTCPHGRPIIVKLTKYEIEKMFKRIV